MVQDAQILFHAGTHKTGTTSIQSTLAYDRARLAQYGFVYPLDRKRFEAHHRFVKHALRTDLSARLRTALRKRSFERELQAGRRLIFSAEPAYRAVLNEKVAPGSPEWFDTHVAALRIIRSSLGSASASALLVFRQPEKLATSLHKEFVAQWTGESPLRDLVGQSADHLHYFQYAQQIKAFEAAFDRVETMDYEAACAGAEGLVGAFYARLGLSAPPPLEAPLRRSVSNLAVRWLQRASSSVDQAEYRLRVLFAAHSGALCLRENEPSTLWPSADDYYRFVDLVSETYDLPFVAPPAPLRLPYTAWSDAQHREAEQAFKEWVAQNSAELARRRSDKVPFYQPMVST